MNKKALKILFLKKKKSSHLLFFLSVHCTFLYSSSALQNAQSSWKIPLRKVANIVVISCHCGSELASFSQSAQALHQHIT